jgi:ribonuclease T
MKHVRKHYILRSLAANMKGVYISCDVEASGPAPPRYSMLSLGMCIVGRKDICFYRELKPLNMNYQLEALKVGALHLECLPKTPTHDPRSAAFDPESTMIWLKEHAETPAIVMYGAATWVRAVAGVHQPIFTTDVQPFDGNFVFSYFTSILDNCPFSYKGRNIDEIYRGIRNNANARLHDLGIKDTRKREHHALEDAIFQSMLAEPILDIIDPDWRTRLQHLDVQQCETILNAPAFR